MPMSRYSPMPGDARSVFEFHDPIKGFEESLAHCEKTVRNLPEEPPHDQEDHERIAEFRAAAERMMRFGYEISSVLFLDLRAGRKLSLKWEALDEFQERLQLNFFNASNPEASLRAKEVRLQEISRDFSILRPFAQTRLDPTIRREMSSSSLTDQEIKTRARVNLLRAGVVLLEVGIMITLLLLLLKQPMTAEWTATIVLFLFFGLVGIMGSGHPERLYRLLTRISSSGRQRVPEERPFEREG